jgi:tRNA(adenine34) deaminase
MAPLPEHEKYMAIALEEARIGASEGEQPFGAVVVLDGEVVVRTHSIKVATSDCTAHSETRAVGLATQKLQRREIPEAVFYATCEPCPMCLGAILNSGIRTLVLGARNAKIKQTARLAFNFKDYSVERFADMVGWDLTVVGGVAEAECEALYTGAAVPLTR